MRFTIDQHIGYLNALFRRIWAASHPLILDHAVHQVARSLPDFLRPARARTTLASPPGVTRSGNSIAVRLPAVGQHVLELGLNLDVAASAAFDIELALSRDVAPTRTFHVNTEVDIPWYVSIAFPIGTIIVEEIVEEVLNAQLGGPGSSLATNVSLLSALKYDRNAPSEPVGLALERMPATPLIGVDPQTPTTSVCAGPLDWIDVVLVADNYEPGDAAAFATLTEEVRRELLVESRLHNQRLRAMGSAIRLWRLPLVGTSSGERLLVTGGGQKPTLNNLARLAEVGLLIEERLVADRGGQPLRTQPIIVVTSKASSNRRAVALGDLVIQFVGTSGEEAGKVLSHELGHVIGALADEYVDGSTEVYLGPEPKAINVSVDPAATGKWQPWLDRVPAASSDPAYRVSPTFNHQGAYSFASGIRRPANNCHMRASGSDVPFCPVCEETLAAALVSRLSHGVATRAPLTLHVEYIAPRLQPPRLYTVDAPLVAGAASRTLELPAASSTRVRIRVVETGVPDPQGGIWDPQGQFLGTEYVDLGRGNAVRFEVKPRSNSPLPAALRNNLRQSVVLDFSAAPSLEVAPPSRLTQNPNPGSVVRRVLDSATGALSVPITLGATAAADPAGNNTETVFALAIGGQEILGAFANDRDQPTAHAVNVRQIAGQRPLPDGAYRWRAFTRVRGTNDVVSADASLPIRGVHFEIQPHEVPAIQTLPIPFGVEVVPFEYLPVVGPGPEARMRPSQLVTQPNPKQLVRVRAYHPAGAPLRVEFEFANLRGAFDGNALVTAGPYLPQGGGAWTLAFDAVAYLTQARQLDPSLDTTTFKVRIRTHDDDGRTSPWLTHTVLV